MPGFHLGEEFAHGGLHFGIETGSLRLLGEFRGGLLHALAEEGAARIVVHRTVGGFGVLHFLLHVLPGVLHLLLTLGSHEGLHHVATDVGHRGHDGFALGLESRLVVNEEVLEHDALVLGQGELTDEDWDIAALKVSFEGFAKVLHASAHAATPAATTLTAAEHVAHAATHAATTLATAALTATLLRIGRRGLREHDRLGGEERCYGEDRATETDGGELIEHVFGSKLTASGARARRRSPRCHRQRFHLRPR